MPHPTRMTTWRLHFSNYGVNAICDYPDTRLGFSLGTFANDPRIAANRQGAASKGQG